MGGGGLPWADAKSGNKLKRSPKAKTREFRNEFGSKYIYLLYIKRL